VVRTDADGMTDAVRDQVRDAFEWVTPSMGRPPEKGLWKRAKIGRSAREL